MEQDNKSMAKFTNTEAMNQKDNISASYLLEDEKSQKQLNCAVTKGSSSTDESRREEVFQS